MSYLYTFLVGAGFTLTVAAMVRGMQWASDHFARMDEQRVIANNAASSFAADFVSQVQDVSDLDATLPTMRKPR